MVDERAVDDGVGLEPVVEEVAAGFPEATDGSDAAAEPAEHALTARVMAIPGTSASLARCVGRARVTRLSECPPAPRAADAGR